MQLQDQFENRDTTNAEEATGVDTPTAQAEDEAQSPGNLEDDAQVAGGSGDVTPAQQAALPRKGFDWVALLVALIIAAFFALTARFNSQPSPSFIPAAIFSATGCGLLITALRKLRARAGAGLREAALAGFGMALFQFAVAFTYPDVYGTIRSAPEYGRAFLVTWGLIGLFAVALTLAGAAIGHLAFAPLRPLSERKAKQSNEDEDEDEGEDEDEDEDEETNASATSISESDDARSNELDEPSSEGTEGEDEESFSEQDTDDEAEDEEPELVEAGVAARPQRSLPNYLVTVLLLGLLPMMVGYVFAASYDFIMQTMNVNRFSPALYPTLSLFSGLLPWRLAAPINLSSGNGSFIVFTLLWRVPDSVLGNPNLFDVQTLEPLLFNALGLAFLLITMYRNDQREAQRQAAPWGLFLLLQALLGLILVLPANLWMLRGLEGVLQLQNLAVQLPTFQLLNPTLFLLNLVTGTLFCLLVSVIVRRQYQLWTMPRQTKTEEQVA